MVRIMKPKSLQYMRFRSTKRKLNRPKFKFSSTCCHSGSMVFLVKAAQIITKISLISIGFIKHDLPLEFLRELFNGKCNSVQVQRNNSHSGAKITLNEIEGLIQVNYRFHLLHFQDLKIAVFTDLTSCGEACLSNDFDWRTHFRSSHRRIHTDHGYS